MNDYCPFIDKRLHIKSTDLGYGIFTNDFIESGTFVEMAPVIICSEPLVDQNIFKYVLAWDNNNLAIPLGWTGLYNHSDNNSCEFSTNWQYGLLAVITLRDIKKDEQLTVSYGSEWFSSRGLEKVLL